MLSWRAQLADLYWRGVESVAPERSVPRGLRWQGEELCWIDETGSAHPLRSPILLLGAGKAAARMAAAAVSMLPAGSYRGVAVASAGNTVNVPGVEVLVGAHPVPDERSQAAAERMLEYARQPELASVLCLLSGGASSLMALPWPPIPLAEKIRVHELLLRCGANVHEMNTVRKHLSRVKGGRLLRALGRDVYTLAISDVVGDDPAVIGSGPTVADPTTFADARAVLQKYALWHEIPATARTVIERGQAGREPETLKPDDPEARWAHYRIVARNRDAVRAAAEQAAAYGWRVEILPTAVVGEAREAARAVAGYVRRTLRGDTSSPVVLVGGGETTVTVRGRGRGGRNQEFALALALAIAEQPVAALCAGTDGIDGPTDAAGAFVDGTTVARAAARGLDPARYLAENNAYAFFAALGDLFLTGPTGSNVMDLYMALVGVPCQLPVGVPHR